MERDFFFRKKKENSLDLYTRARSLLLFNCKSDPVHLSKVCKSENMAGNGEVDGIHDVSSE